jgi:dimethylglycine catabolism A
VDVGYPVADDQLYRELEAELATPQGGPRVYLIGDANAPRSALEAVYEGRITGGFLGRDDSEIARRTALVY